MLLFLSVQKFGQFGKTTRPEQQTKVFHLVVKRSTRLRPQTKVLRFEFLKHGT
jgi:hypothetical protein